jgi:hypothetical protein
MRLLLVCLDLGSILVSAVPAWGAAPANDAFADATAVTALPLAQTIDTTEATWDVTDPQSPLV